MLIALHKRGALFQKVTLVLVALSWLSFQCQHCLAAAEVPPRAAGMAGDCHRGADSADTAAGGSKQCDCVFPAAIADRTSDPDRTPATPANNTLWLAAANSITHQALPIGDARLNYSYPEHATLLPLERFCVLLN